MSYHVDRDRPGCVVSTFVAPTFVAPTFLILAVMAAQL
jgi:hypothetical protein